MKIYKRTENIEKIIKAMDKVWEDLIKYKKEKNSDIIISRNGKIIRINPHTMKETDF